VSSAACPDVRGCHTAEHVKETRRDTKKWGRRQEAQSVTEEEMMKGAKRTAWVFSF